MRGKPLTLRIYIVKRVIISIFVLWLVATINFVVFRYQWTSFPGFSVIPAETKEMLIQTYGAYDPLYIRYLKYLRNMFTFGVVPPYLGWSSQHHEFVAEGLAWRLPITLFLLGTALTGSIILGILIGMLAASKQGTKTDVGLICSSLLTWAIPAFLIQILAIVLFGKILRDTYGINVFTTSWTPPRTPVRNLEWWATAFSQLTLPILTLVLVGFGTWAFRTRYMLIDALTQDFIITARAKGLSERAVSYKHGFKSILPQIFTMITLSIPVLITGSFITENIFGIEGIGRYFIKSMTVLMLEREVLVVDPAVVQAVVFISATLVVVLNLIADIIYGVVDPRIRVGTRR